MAMTTQTIGTTLLLITVSLLGPPTPCLAQQDRTKLLEQRVAALERVVLMLQQRVAKLEAALERPYKSVRPGVAKGNWREKSNWRRLRKGMTMDQVTELLGEPEKVRAGSYLTVWYWGHPGGGSVDFDGETSRVDGWDEP